MRWRRGDTNPVNAPVHADTCIEIGDLVQFTPTGGVELLDKTEHFLGVALQRSLVGESDPIRVATTGVFEFWVGSVRPMHIGEMVRCCKAQAVEHTLEKPFAIGRVAATPKYPSHHDLASVLVTIMSRVMGPVA